MTREATALKLPRREAEPKANSTKMRLLQSAQVLFARKGFHATSTREITRRAKTNAASLYFHWRTKENLYLAVHQRLFQQTIQMRQRVLERIEEGMRARRPPEEVLFPVADIIFDFFAANPDIGRLNFHRMLEGGPLAKKVEEEFESAYYRAAAQLYQRLTEEGFMHVRDPAFLPFSLEVQLDVYFVNPERLERASGVSGTALRERMRAHFRETLVRLMVGR